MKIGKRKFDIPYFDWDAGTVKKKHKRVEDLQLDCSKGEPGLDLLGDGFMIDDKGGLRRQYMVMLNPGDSGPWEVMDMQDGTWEYYTSRIFGKMGWGQPEELQLYPGEWLDYVKRVNEERRKPLSLQKLAEIEPMAVMQIRKGYSGYYPEFESEAMVEAYKKKFPEKFVEKEKKKATNKKKTGKKVPNDANV